MRYWRFARVTYGKSTTDVTRSGLMPPDRVGVFQEGRDAINAAMERLLAGTPLRSSGNLDIISLAEEAGLKRNKLTHKHTDLKDRFFAERRCPFTG